MRIVRGVTIAVAAGLACGCNTGLGFLNPEFLTDIGLAPAAARLPGEAPLVVLGVRNDTSRVAEFLLSWRDGESEVFQRTSGLVQPGGLLMFGEFCPVDEVTLGDVANLNTVGAIVRLGGGTSNDATIDVEPFGVLLQRGINYECGDRIIFSVRPSGDTLSGYRAFATVEASGLQSSEDEDDEDEDASGG